MNFYVGTNDYDYTFKYYIELYYWEGYYNYSEYNFNQDKALMEESVNRYKGFYIGRYETTIDETGVIGSMPKTEVLTSSHTLKDGISNKSNDEYHYRWWGLYKVQKEMYEGNKTVFSNMITSKQWDEILKFTEYNNATRALNTYTNKPDVSGSAYATNLTLYDVSKNIYDLAGNLREWTLTTDDIHQVYRSSGYTDTLPASSKRYHFSCNERLYMRF